MIIYLDCNATAPVEPEVQDIVIHYLTEEYGNAGSRTHEFGARAKKAVEQARRQVADVVGAAPDEVTFTSGATESNNLAILGLADHGQRAGRRHIVTTAIEHKAVLEPIEHLQARGFEVTLVPPSRAGYVRTADILQAVRADTLLVSVMQANNETGILQPIAEIAESLAEDGPLFHVDAAQGFGKELGAIRHRRIDLISVSSHKAYGPKGVGALVGRRRMGNRRPPLSPLMYGGGQERGWRPGSLPVHLIAGLGEAAEIAVRDNEARRQRCQQIRRRIIEALAPLGVEVHGDEARTLPHVLNFSMPGVDSEAAMLVLKGTAAVSNGSACTSHSYTPSHVLRAMGLAEDEVEGALRLSWCHMTPDFDWKRLAVALRGLQ